jgi:hypothetical protein
MAMVPRMAHEALATFDVLHTWDARPHPGPDPVPDPDPAPEPGPQPTPDPSPEPGPGGPIPRG